MDSNLAGVDTAVYPALSLPIEILLPVMMIGLVGVP